MKIYYFSDKSFLQMKTNFELSFKDTFNRQFQFLEKINVDRSKPGSGVDIWKYKTEMIIDAIKSNMNDIIIISDIDIVFYKPVIPIVSECMINTDICFQKETRNSGINIGFISIYCNDTTLHFWNKVYEILSTTNRWDQEIVNDLIYNKKFNIKWNLFPSSIWNWSQGNLNKHIVLHHANCASSEEEKLKQIKYVSDFINE